MQQMIEAESCEAELEARWQEFLEMPHTPEQILDVVGTVEPLREKAWRVYCGTGVTDERLIELLVNSNYSWMQEYPCRRLIEQTSDQMILSWLIKNKTICQMEAVSKLLSLNPGVSTLYPLVSISTLETSLREKIAQALLLQPRTKAQLLEILEYSPATAEQVGRLLLTEESLEDQYLARIVSRAPSLVGEIWEKRQSTIGERTLRVIISMKSRPSFSLEAARKFLDMSGGFDALFEIWKNVPELREETWVKFQKIELSEAWGGALIREAPEFEARVRPLIKHPPHDAEAVISQLRDLGRQVENSRK